MRRHSYRRTSVSRETEQIAKLIQAADSKSVAVGDLWMNVSNLLTTELYGGMIMDRGSYRGWTPPGSSTNTAKVWLDTERGILLTRFAYSQEAVKDVQDTIPKGKRNWKPEERVWEISVECLDDLLGLLARHFDSVIDLTQQSPQIIPMGSNDAEFWSILDGEDLKSIQRLLTNKYHPDRAGGDGKKMAAINSFLQTRRGAK